MISSLRVQKQRDLRDVVLFYLITCAYTWLMWSPVMLFPSAADRLVGIVSWPCTYGPTVGAIATAWITTGRKETWRWLKSIYRWRIPFIWYLTGAVLLNVAFAALHLGTVSLLGGRIALVEGPIPWYGHLVLFLVSVSVLWPIGSGAGEETGWRGFALPKLLDHMHPLLANLILGLAWALWHLPMLLTPAWSGSSQGVLPFFIYVIPLSVIMSWLWSNSHGSVVPSAMLHSGSNTYSRLLGGDMLALSTVYVAGTAFGFTEIKAIVYGVVALVIVVATKGRLGHAAPGTQPRTDEVDVVTAPAQSVTS
jgi:membrane protease YdiL (CAAX protease family)